jgi:hypothetical protein
MLSALVEGRVLAIIKVPSQSLPDGTEEKHQVQFLLLSNRTVVCDL